MELTVTFECITKGPKEINSKHQQTKETQPKKPKDKRTSTHNIEGRKELNSNHQKAIKKKTTRNVKELREINSKHQQTKKLNSKHQKTEAHQLKTTNDNRNLTQNTKE